MLHLHFLLVKGQRDQKADHESRAQDAQQEHDEGGRTRNCL
jgi:hypothetical protein